MDSKKRDTIKLLKGKCQTCTKYIGFKEIKRGIYKGKKIYCTICVNKPHSEFIKNCNGYIDISLINEKLRITEDYEVES